MGDNPAQQQQIVSATPEEVRERMKQGKFFIFVDARRRQDWERSDTRLPRAIRVPPEEAEAHVQNVAGGHEIITYCSDPDQAASTRVAQTLNRRGKWEARPLAGGFEAWKEKGFPVEPKV